MSFGNIIQKEIKLIMLTIQYFIAKIAIACGVKFQNTLILYCGGYTQKVIFLALIKKEKNAQTVGVQMEELKLFDMAPKEKTGEIQKTEIEYLVIAFDEGKKRKMIKMLESLLKKQHIDVYADYLYKLVEEKYEKNNS